MTQVAADMVMAGFLIFCRIGACLMLMPGYGSVHVPAQIRLLLAVTISLSLTPIIYPTLLSTVRGASDAGTLSLIPSELLIGGLIGLMGRLFFLALETLATASAMAIGLGSMPGVPVEGGESLPALAPLVGVTAVALFFMTDLHWEVLRGLASSYRVWRPAEGFDAQGALTQITDRLSDSFVLALRISSPFMIYGVIVNLAVGLVNKLTPTIPVYFISVPFVLLGGLLLLHLTISEYLIQFMQGVEAWLGG